MANCVFWFILIFCVLSLTSMVDSDADCSSFTLHFYTKECGKKPVAKRRACCIKNKKDCEKYMKKKKIEDKCKSKCNIVDNDKEGDIIQCRAVSQTKSLNATAIAATTTTKPKNFKPKMGMKNPLKKFFG